MKYIKLLHLNWHSVNADSHSHSLYNPCPGTVPCGWQMRALVSWLNDRNKMSLIPREKEEEQKQRDTWVAFS